MDTILRHNDGGNKKKEREREREREKMWKKVTISWDNYKTNSLEKK